MSLTPTGVFKTDLSILTALALAMSRDGSSGGTIRMAIIQESGVERIFVPGDQLPSASFCSCPEEHY